MRLRDLAFLILGAALAIFAQGLAAPELFTEVSQWRFGPVRDDTFQQTDMHTDNYLHPVGAAIGVQDKLGRSEVFGYRVALQAAGAYKARDNASVDDGNAHNHSGVPCTPPSEEGCALRFNGEGRVHGVSLGLTAEQPLSFPRLSLIGEAGFFFYAQHFKAEARFVDCPICFRSISYNESSRIWDAPSPFAGLTLRWRGFYVFARHFWPSGHRALAVTDGSMSMYGIGVPF